MPTTEAIVRESLGIPDNVEITPDANIRTISNATDTQLRTLLEKLSDDMMPLSDDSEWCWEFFTYGMSLEKPAEGFTEGKFSCTESDPGNPWTMQRLSALLEVWYDALPGDNGSD